MPIVLDLSTAADTEVRFALSPLVELGWAWHVLVGADHHPERVDWTADTRALLPADLARDVEDWSFAVRAVRSTLLVDPTLAPVLVWLHGGAWIRGDLDTWDTPLTHLAHQTNAVVASVDYRRAPATKFPAPLYDVLAALRHLAEHADRLGLDAGKIAIGGDSAGGNLAAGATLVVCDLALGSPLVAQVLIHPPTDPGCATDSFLHYADGYALSRKLRALRVGAVPAHSICG